MTSVQAAAASAYRRLLREDRLLFDASEALRDLGAGEWIAGIEIERHKLAMRLEKLQAEAYRAFAPAALRRGRGT
ncbi:MAG TPA: hypothetical protein VG889_15595 [Rhizomicrobium sp.]|nr:hypothetical protein [Rhizomicrobium sp.]